MIDLLNSTILRLKEKKIPNPELDLRILLKQASHKKQDIILSTLKKEDIDIKYFNELILKRLKRKPISKIIKKKYFWKDEFYVNTNVLDPRPESELIIEQVLKNIQDKEKKLNILDIGTGSGCLAISLAKEFKKSKITALDISKKALSVAKKNIFSHNVNNQVSLKLGDIKNINTKYDLIISNPPYVDHYQYNNLQIEIKNFEPKTALLGGKDGLKFYKIFSKKLDYIMKKKNLYSFAKSELVN